MDKIFKFFSNTRNGLIIAGCMIVILTLITVLNPASFSFKNQIDYGQLKQQAIDEENQYKEYLSSIKVDPVASKQLYATLLDENQVKAEVESKLNVTQKVNLPYIADADINTVNSNDGNALNAYYTKYAESTLPYVNQTGSVTNEVYDPNADIASLDSAINATSTRIASLKSAPTPTDFKEYQKTEIGIATTYKNLLADAKSYTASGATETTWSKMYGNYLALNSQTATRNDYLNQLDKKYNLKSLTININTKKGLVQKLNPFYINHAEAFLGIGDIQITSFDIPRKIDQIIGQAISSSFSNFLTTFIDELIPRIEDNYKISSFMYYTDALVSGQYLNEYLNKYVKDPLDRGLITKFIPQIACADNKSSVTDIFKAKSTTFFNPKTVNPDSPDFYNQLQKAGQVEATPAGQRELYEAYASGALAKSYESAMTELLNQNGLKTPRTLTGKVIATTVSNIGEQLKAAINAKFELGTSNPDNLVSQVVATGLNTFINKFVFKGAVFKEQSTCINFPQLDPVIPGLNGAKYTPPIFDEGIIRQEVESQVPAGAVNATGQ